jgi:hypothetical protein
MMLKILGKLVNPLLRTATRSIARKAGDFSAKTVGKFVLQGAAAAALTGGAISMGNAVSRTGRRIWGSVPRPQGELIIPDKGPDQGGPKETHLGVHH